MDNGRTKLSDDEFILITVWLSRIKMDSEIDIISIDSGTDMFMDFGTGKLLSLEEGFQELAEAVAYPLTHEGFSAEENRKFFELLVEFGVSGEQLGYIESLKDM